jgi:mono/diheme cytochrome c family protein
MKSKLSILYLITCAFLWISCGDKTYSQGERLYKAHCGNCHMDDGLGLAKLIPPLANSDYLKNNQEKIACIIRYGQSGKIIVNGIKYDQVMPGQKYTEIQINNMINYINTAWGNDIPVVSITQTKTLLESCSK